MDDEAENRVLVDAFQSHVRLLYQVGQNIWNRCSFVIYVKNFCRVYLLKNECLLAFAVILAVLLIFQYGNIVGRLLGKRFVVFFPQSGIRLPGGGDSRTSTSSNGESSRSVAARATSSAAAAFRAAAASFVLPPEKENIVLEERSSIAAAYAVQGRRTTMEDRFIIRENIGGTGVHLFAVFDGHGGSFSAEFAQRSLLVKLEKEITANPGKYSGKSKNNSEGDELSGECMRNSVNLVKLIKSEIAATDKELIREAISVGSPSGTTALIALQNDEFLVVGNVGDSRGVMCCNTSEGQRSSIPLSYDHKPDQLKEKKRIEEAGGWVIFNGVWRVQGVLAVSRALGDTPFKGRKLVISDPDVLCFPLNGSLDPQFYILASDGLWDVFSNEEAVKFAHERFSRNEDVASVSRQLALEGVGRGSMDNVCVLSVLLPTRGKKLADRRKSVSSPGLARKTRISRRVVSAEELEHRQSAMRSKNKDDGNKVLSSVNEDADK